MFKGFYSEPRFHASSIFAKFKSKNLHQSYSSTKVIIQIEKHLRQQNHMITLRFCPSVWYQKLAWPMD